MKSFKKIFFLGTSFLLLSVPLMSLAQTQSQWFGANVSYRFGLPQKDIGGSWGIINAFMFWVLGILGFLGIIGFAISGFLYMTSAGDEDKMQTAKRAMVYSIIGVVVALSAVVIISAIEKALNGFSRY